MAEVESLAQVNARLSEIIAARPQTTWHDDELLTPAGKAAHAARVRALAGDRQARADLRDRWDAVLKDGSSPLPVIDLRGARL